MLRIGINGFGRIGRLVLRALLEKNETDLEVLAINDLGSLEQNIHLLKYDTVHGMLPFETSFRDNIANIGDQEIKFYNKRSPNEIPWEDHGIDIVLECTGIFTKAEDAKKHLKGSVKKVLISAPSSNADITVVYGVNDKLFKMFKDGREAIVMKNYDLVHLQILNIRKLYILKNNKKTRDQE